MTDAAQPTTPASPVVFVVEYSEKAIALVGDTRAMKDQLAALGAKWNGSLKCGKGWIVSKKRKDAIVQLSGAKEITMAEWMAKCAAESAGIDTDKASVATFGEVEVVQYSERSLACIGQTFELRNVIKDNGGKFNKFLKVRGRQVPGWIVAIKNQENLLAVLQLAAGGGGGGGGAKRALEPDTAAASEPDAKLARVSEATPDAALEPATENKQ